MALSHKHWREFGALTKSYLDQNLYHTCATTTNGAARFVMENPMSTTWDMEDERKLEMAFKRIDQKCSHIGQTVQNAVDEVEINENK